MKQHTLTITNEDGQCVVSCQLPNIDPFTATTIVLNALAAAPKRRTRKSKAVNQSVTVR